MTKLIDFRTDPASYRHWRVEYDGDVATILMDVDEAGGLFAGYVLRLTSYGRGLETGGGKERNKGEGDGGGAGPAAGRLSDWATCGAAQARPHKTAAARS